MTRLAPAAVGSGLIVQPTGQAALAALGLLDDLKRRGARLDRLDGRLPGGRRKVLDVRYAALGPDVFGISVHRAALFELLLRAAREAGAAFHYGREVAGVADDGADMRVVFSNGAGSEPFDLVIDGLGVKSPLSNAGTVSSIMAPCGRMRRFPPNTDLPITS
ncbi:MAG: hypothetical protein R3C58_11015 [Parvularculaceae bacterium]